MQVFLPSVAVCFGFHFIEVRTIHAEGIKNLMEKSVLENVYVARVTITWEGWQRFAY